MDESEKNVFENIGENAEENINSPDPAPTENSEKGYSSAEAENVENSLNEPTVQYETETQPIRENTGSVEGNPVPEENRYYGDLHNIPYVSPVPVSDYKPMSKGLKVFAAIMAVVILMTASCATGYFFGKNGVNASLNRKIDMGLSAKPKNTDEMTAAEVYQKVNKSVVGIEIYGEEQAIGMASGVVYSKDGYIITNDHIYADFAAAKFKIYDYKGREYDAEYVAGDVISDLALLKVKNGKGFTVPDFGDSKQLVFGETVVAIGRPKDATADSSITKGIISHTNRRITGQTTNYTTRLIQTDSAINPGSSGGALVNMYGQIIGITSSKLEGAEYDAVGFSIPTATVKRVVTQLAEKGKVVDRAKLGITYSELTSLTAKMGNYKSAGLLIASVSSDSDLYGKANKNDIITHINGKKITSQTVILDVIDESHAGDTITLTVLNTKGKSRDYKVKLKANIGESSYSLEKSKDKDNGSKVEKLPNNGGDDGIFSIPDGGSDGGTFNFPDGE